MKQREIKFRAKRIDNGEWVFGYGVILGEHYDIKTDDEREASIFVNFDKVSGLNYQLVEVDPKTVGQYTGLKDKNGKEIFEGDLVGNFYRDPMFKAFKVEMWEGKWVFRNKDDEGNLSNWDLFNHCKEIEVIGNVYEGVLSKYENPELLKQK